MCLPEVIWLQDRFMIKLVMEALQHLRVKYIDGRN
jgi:hypothetical protein